MHWFLKDKSGLPTNKSKVELYTGLRVYALQHLRHLTSGYQFTQCVSKDKDPITKGFFANRLKQRFFIGETS